MSRTNRNHWMKEEMRDGVKRTKIKRKKEEKVDEFDWFLRQEGEYEWTCLTCGVEVDDGVWECEDCK